MSSSLILSTSAGPATLVASAKQAIASRTGREKVIFNLNVSDGKKETLLRSAQEIYDACASVDLSSTVDVVPFLPASTSSSSQFTKMSWPVMSKTSNFTPAYDYVAVGGTFDHLHSGHKMLLTTSLAHVIKKLRVGLTSTELLKKKKHAEYLQTFEERKHVLLSFLTSVREDVEFEIDEISDMPGGTDKIEGVEALVVSPETAGAVEAINKLRAENGFKPMVGIPIAFVGGSTDAERVSSTKLRSILSEAK